MSTVGDPRSDLHRLNSDTAPQWRIVDHGNTTFHDWCVVRDELAGRWCASHANHTEAEAIAIRDGLNAAIPSLPDSAPHAALAALVDKAANHCGAFNAGAWADRMAEWLAAHGVRVAPTTNSGNADSSLVVDGSLEGGKEPQQAEGK